MKINHKILILGGSTQASELLKQIQRYTDIQPILSLAGTTKNPVLPENNYRIGGFGGVNGLSEYIRQNSIKALICATHPFAAKMPFNALEAAKTTDIPLIYILRPEWKPQKKDNWLEVNDHTQAVKFINLETKTKSPKIFLTVGRLELAQYKNTNCQYLIRTIDDLVEKPLENSIYITARPPFSVDDEINIMKKHKIDFLVTKNSGGKATEAKLTAARKLGIKIIMIKRPPRPDFLHVTNVKDAIEWLNIVNCLYFSLQK
ncbi:MAG: cobalt-precorrin-6A reductase [Rickettsiales bacterium]